jgi:tryptophanyl-tRNA synthetase
MSRILSGIQATGALHLGNYLGALRAWGERPQADAFFFIPDLHSLNVRPKPELLRRERLANLAWLLAAGVNPKQATIYVQSQIPAHTELCWILNNFVTMGELGRMTQYKDKASQRGAEGELVALFTYPVLMAADILLYDAEEVPVGEDQVQHVELARDIATRFNNLYGQTFTLPQAVLPQLGARIMNLVQPQRKMSKSDADQSGVVMLLDDLATIKRKIQKAVTDSGDTVAAGDDRPALTNLLQIYAALSKQAVTEVEEAYAGQGYAAFKGDLADLVAQNLGELQTKYHHYADDPQQLEEILQEGRAKAQPIAEGKLSQVKTKLGLL